MSNRVKLTAGGSKKVAEWKRYTCPNCKSNYYIHPTRWRPHLEECLKKLSIVTKLTLCQQAEDLETKEHIASIVLEAEKNGVLH